jgi:hypothetical protein
LRPIDPEDNDVLVRVLNEEGVRGGHEIGPIELGECPGNIRRLFGAQVYDGKGVDDTGPDFVARPGNAMGGPDEIAAHLRRSEFRFRRQQQCRNPAHMGRGNRCP